MTSRPQARAPVMKLPPSHVDASADPVDEVDRPEDAASVRCAACGSIVALGSDRVERHGASEHDRVNPAGFVFRIACFVRADGATLVGPPSMEFAWFPRAPWRVARCGACGVHLGWWFGGDAPFFGLDVRAIVGGH